MSVTEAARPVASQRRGSPAGSSRRPRGQGWKRVRRGPALILVLVGVLLVLFPVYWMFVTSLTSDKDLTSSTPSFLPDLSRLGIYRDVLADTQILKWLRNSAVIAIGTAVCTMVLSFFAAYALSRYRFKGQTVFGFALFATQMLPEALLVVPFYALFVSLGLLNNLGGLVLVHTAFVMPVVVFLLKSAIDGVPVEIEESAKMDGASSLATATLVVAPLIAPSLAAGSIVAFFYGWDEFLFASTFITDESSRPASVGLASFIGEYLVPINTVMAASAIYTLPAIAFFVLLQRYVVSGLISGSIKG